MATAKYLNDVSGMADDSGVALAAGGKSKSASKAFAANVAVQEVVALVAGKQIQRTVMLIEPAEGATWQWYSAAAAISQAYSVPMAIAAPKVGKNTAAGEALGLLVTGGAVVVDIEYIEVDA